MAKSGLDSILQCGPINSRVRNSRRSGQNVAVVVIAYVIFLISEQLNCINIACFSLQYLHKKTEWNEIQQQELEQTVVSTYWFWKGLVPISISIVPIIIPVAQPDGGMSVVHDFYDNAAVLITGGTGFIGKVLVEKLLRSFSIRKIYLLIRSAWTTDCTSSSRNRYVRSML